MNNNTYTHISTYLGKEGRERRRERGRRKKKEEGEGETNVVHNTVHTHIVFQLYGGESNPPTLSTTTLISLSLLNLKFMDTFSNKLDTLHTTILQLAFS